MDSVKKYMASQLKAARKKKGLSVDEVGKAVGKSGKTISAWEVGRGQPNGDELLPLCRLLEVSLADLWAPRGSVEYAVVSLGDSDFVDRPVMGEIAAGTPIDMTEIIDNHPCPRQIADKHPNSGWLRVEGDSYNKSIPNGCLALIDFDLKEPNEHSPFAVCVNGYKATIKRVKRLANGYELIPNSYDPTYLPMIYDYNKDDTEEITIIGQVVYAAFPFDWEF